MSKNEMPIKFGDVLEEQGLLDEAAVWWEERAKQSCLPEDFCRTALVNVTLKRWAHAEFFYREALRADVSSVEAMEGLALLAIQRDDFSPDLRYDEAYFWINRALRQSNTADLLYVLSIVHELKKEPTVARSALERALLIDPDNVRVLERLTSLEIDGLGLVFAKAHLDRILDLDSDNAFALQALGREAQHSGKNEIARDHFEHAIRSNPSDPWSYLYLGNLYSVMGLSVEAHATYAQAETLFPDDENVKRFAGRFRSHGPQ